MDRKAGILMPISSLWGPFGIGSFSKSAYDFIDFLKSADQSYWQVLPMCPTSFGDSPYQSPSTFAGNPYFISLETLIEEGLLSEKECTSADFGNKSDDIDYQKQYENRFPLLKKAYERSNHKNSPEYLEFIKENEDWLSNYALFMALKWHFEEKEWLLWEEDIKRRKPEAIAWYENLLSYDIDFWKFLQFEFFKEWKKLKSYANQKGIAIIGDMPIYTALDSSDVWANPELFKLRDDFYPTSCAGCPPDGFSEDGQLWGNPLYQWDMHKKTDYVWWKKRLSHHLKLYDGVRIDHFRGFDEYYSIPFGSLDAKGGKWEKGPGMDLFSALSPITDGHLIIAEDLGFLTPSVKKLLKDSGFPGMKILEFAFDSRDTGTASDYLPHAYPENCVAYTGTHDNQTLCDWINTISKDERHAVRKYLCDFATPRAELHIPLIAELLKSKADLVIIPIQDYLGLGAESRINTPSTLGTNWRWRICEDMVGNDLAEKISDMTKRYGRN